MLIYFVFSGDNGVHEVLLLMPYHKVLQPISLFPAVFQCAFNCSHRITVDNYITVCTIIIYNLKKHLKFVAYNMFKHTPSTRDNVHWFRVGIHFLVFYVH